MVTDTQRIDFRNAVGDTGSVFDDPAIDLKFKQAAVKYPSGSDELLLASAVVSGLRELLVNAARLTSYTQNQTSESAGQVFDHLQALLKFWKGELAEASKGSYSGVRFGAALKAKPERHEEYPDE